MADPRCVVCNPDGERLGYCSRHVLDILNEPEPCRHRHTSEEMAYPQRDGRCAVLAVCEDCGEVLGQVGWDRVE